MSPSEVLIFRDYSGWEEPALMTPFGFMSLRNLAVLGILGGVAALLYWAVVPDDLDAKEDWPAVCAALMPLAAGLALAVIKPRFGTADSVLLALLALLPLRAPKRATSRSKVLGFPRRLSPAAPKDDYVHKIVCADLEELKSIRVTLHGGDGLVLGSRLVKCYLDDELADTLRTSAEGSLVLHVRPGREGARSLVIRRAEGGSGDGAGDDILLRRSLHFVRRMQ